MKAIQLVWFGFVATLWACGGGGDTDAPVGADGAVNNDIGVLGDTGGPGDTGTVDA